MTLLVYPARPDPYSSNNVLALEDNSKTLVLTSTPQITVPAGLPSGFGCTLYGALTYTTSGGATVTDRRVNNTVAVCSLLQIGVDAYALVGGY